MSIHGKSILVIDDDAAMLRALKKVLSSEGALVTTVCCVGEAMEHLTDKWERVDLIITDIRMPILGGQTILGAAGVALPQVPVIMITAFATPELEAECLQCGAAAFLEKPVDSLELLAAIEKAFAARKPGFLRRALRLRKVKKAKVATAGGQTDFFGEVKAFTHSSS